MKRSPHFIAALLAAASAAATALEDRSRVEFRIPAAPPTAFEIERAAVLGRAVTRRTAETLEGTLSRPAGAGPFPALVLMHPCHEASHYEPWAERLVGWG